jgi:glycosyltransferase involved in cell wall biosynthesis
MPEQTAQPSSPVDLTIFVPAYNEEKLIGKTLDTILEAASAFAFSYETLIYNDASRDRTAEVTQQWINEHNAGDRFFLVTNEKNAGIGVNYFRAAERGHGEYFMVLFGDNAEPAESMRRVFNLMGKADVIIPYFDTRLFDLRYNGDNRVFIRRFLSIAFAWIVRVVSGINVHYWNGFVMHRRQNVLKHKVEAYGLGYQAEMLCKILGEPGVSFLQVKCFNIDRASGMPTAFKLKNIVSVLQSLWRIFQDRIHRPPLARP